jgi:FAD/FMN-containing dehydrogenase/Fe-S oxidoreductase
MRSAQQLQDDLRGEFRGSLRFDPPTLGLYATDASPFQVVPFGVAVPADETDLVTLVRYAHEHGIPLQPRGAGTGLAGESLGPGLVVDLTTGFRSVLDVTPEFVRAEVGVTPRELNAALAPLGRRFAPDIHTADTCTVGGVVANNASGPNLFRHGYTRDHLRGLRVVWDTGEVADLRSPPEPLAEAGMRTTEIRSQTAGLLAAHRELLQLSRPATPFTRCGYQLHDVSTADGLDLAKVLVGSEGTLGIVTSATFHAVPVAGGSAAFVAAFDTLAAALRAGLTLRAADGVVSCDLLDQRLLSLARRQLAGSPVAVPPGAAAVLVAGFEADSPAAAADAATAGLARIRAAFPLTPLTDPATPGGLAAVREFRAAVSAGLYSGSARARPTAFVEDVAVPGEELVRFVAGANELLRRNDLSGSFLVHVLAGVVHTRPLVDLADPEDRRRMWAVAEQMHSLAIALGGTVSGQHATGLARTPWVRKQFGDGVAGVFRELKQVFDPTGILNPGKIVGPDPSRPAWPFREQEAGEAVADAPSERVPLLLWGASSPVAEAARCNGCGDCRSRAAPTRMCPMFHIHGTEEATPRAKAGLIRHLTGARAEPLAEDEARAVADLCVNCKMCRSECPSQVNVPKLALEAKAAHHATRGLDRDHWFLARIEWLTGFAANFPLVSNLLLGRPGFRWLLEKTFGLSRRRTLPRLSHRTFLRRAKRAGLTRVPPHTPGAARLAYFADTFVNYADPTVGEAAVAVLRHHGAEVVVPARQRGSGVAPLAQGDVETATDRAEYTVRVLAELVRDGFTVVCSEPTAALTLTQDYRDLLDSADAVAVAQNTVELTDLLWRWHGDGTLRTDFTPLNLTLGHHVPCHVKALTDTPAGPKLLALIPGVTVTTIDRGCSGMAGPHGLLASAYTGSLKAGERLFEELRKPDVTFGSTECGPCRLQMQEGGGKRALHPIQYLAAAYGLLPGLLNRLAKPLRKLVSD